MWLLFSQFGSFTDAIKNIFLKSVDKELDSVPVMWAWFFFTILVLLPLGLWHGVPEVGTIFLVTILVRMVMDPVAILLFTQSMRSAEISLVLPLLSIGPIFTLMTAVFLNHETPSFLGLLGCLLILSGVYFLNLTRELGFLSPIKHFFHSQASVKMAAAAAIWGVQTSILKVGLATGVSPAFYTLVGTVGIFLVFSVIVLGVRRYRQQLPALLTKQNLKVLSLVGLFDGVTVFLRMTALAFGLAGYVSALNRTSIVFSSVLGYFLFKEHLGRRVVPIIVMLVGVVLVVLG